MPREAGKLKHRGKVEVLNGGHPTAKGREVNGSDGLEREIERISLEIVNNINVVPGVDTVLILFAFHSCSLPQASHCSTNRIQTRLPR